MTSSILPIKSNYAPPTNSSLTKEVFVLSRCKVSFNNNATAYLSCVGQNLNAKEIEKVINSNLQLASSERGELSKAIRTTTGVSISDIRNHGILGGKNSEVRKLRKILFE